MSLREIGMINPKYEEELRSKAFATALLPNGKYKCAGCGKVFPDRIFLQVDHIIPLNKKEGKTVPENLQILCRSCNARKSDK